MGDLPGAGDLIPVLVAMFRVPDAGNCRSRAPLGSHLQASAQGQVPDEAPIPCISQPYRERAPETGSHQTPRTAIQSAAAETPRPSPAAIPETPALSRGLGSGAQPNPNRRRRASGRSRAAGRVRLCCQVGRSGFAADSRALRRLRASIQRSHRLLPLRTQAELCNPSLDVGDVEIRTA